MRYNSKKLLRSNNITNINKWFKMINKCTLMSVLMAFHERSCFVSSEVLEVREGSGLCINNRALVHTVCCGNSCLFLFEDDQVLETMKSSFVVLT